MNSKRFYYKNNRLSQLRGFCYVAQQESVSEAAKALKVTPPAVTLQIQALERDLGLPLFHREKKRILLTEEGKQLYKMVIPYIQGIDGVFEELLYDLQKKKVKVLDIAGNHACVLYIIPKFIKQFNALYPDVKIHVRNLPMEDAFKRLRNGEIDLFFYPLSYIQDEFEGIPIVDYDPILLLRKDHPLATKGNVTLEEVATYPLVRIDPHLITLHMFEDVIQHHGIGSNIVFENSDWEVLKKFVLAEVGVAIVSNIVLDGNDGKLMGIPMTQYFPRMTYGAIYKKGRYQTPTVQNFIKLLKEY